ncbi:nuclear transport factor 2-like protein [Microlunatus parietis]|uniref:SnoaL-like domain-containing protein n=1 Tax=Microlunatus parietis TaxID=682979 RepID=A0A7Y9LCT0_9ACTN|nr:isomerase [Microlunatus parietis]NYE71236.1 hypothetical protein [Microlunatus parietis]
MITNEAVREAVDTYLAFLNAAAPAEQALTDDVEYAAPVGVLTGPAALIDFRDQFRDHFDAVAVRATEEPETHHDRARLRWEITVGGSRFAAGSDVITVAADGRVAAVTTFLDQAPEGFDPDAHH